MDIKDVSTKFQTDWTSIYVVTLVAFIGAVHTNCIAPTVYPYLQKLEPSASENFYGLLRSTSSVGSVSSALAAGYISNRLRDTKYPMVVAKIMALISCFLYMNIETLHSHRAAMFLFFELFLGISVGAAGIYRAHIAMTSTEHDRPRAVAICSLAPAIGLLLGPMSQLAFTALGYPGLSFLFGWHINLFTAPILLTMIISIVGLLLLLFLFDGRMRVDTQQATVLCDKNGEIDYSEMSETKKLKFDYVAVAVCMFTRMLVSVTTLNFMTIGAPYTMTVFRWTSAEAVVGLSITLGLVGVNVIFWNLAYIFFNLRKRLSERRAIVISVFVLLLAYLITYPWSFLSSTIAYQEIRADPLNSTSPAEYEPVGCKREYEWCGKTPAVNMIVFLGSLIVSMGFALPLCQINLDILFSKILGPIRQGAMQGWFIVCGDGLSIVGPMLLSQVYTKFGPIYIWQFEIGIIIACIALWLVFYKRMISHSRRVAEAGI